MKSGLVLQLVLCPVVFGISSGPRIRIFSPNKRYYSVSDTLRTPGCIDRFAQDCSFCGLHPFGEKDGTRKAKYDLTTKEIKEIKKKFMLFDRDGDGKITTEDVIAVSRKLNPNKEFENEIVETLKEVDENADGTIGFGQFLVVMGKRNAIINQRDELDDLFRKYDQDSDGFITLEELGNALRSGKEDNEYQPIHEIFDFEIEEFFDAMDSNGDGRIDYKEFIAFMTSKKSFVTRLQSALKDMCRIRTYRMIVRRVLCRYRRIVRRVRGKQIPDVPHM